MGIVAIGAHVLVVAGWGGRYTTGATSLTARGKPPAYLTNRSRGCVWRMHARCCSCLLCCTNSRNVPVGGGGGLFFVAVSPQIFPAVEELQIAVDLMKFLETVCIADLLRRGHFLLGVIFRGLKACMLIFHSMYPSILKTTACSVKVLTARYFFF